MPTENSKVIDIKGYLKRHPSFRQNEIEMLIAEQRSGLRDLDSKVMSLLSTQHKLKAAESCKDASVKLESGLIAISDWLEDRIAEAKSEDVQASHRILLKQCEQLILRNERIKKNISDEISTCRYLEGKKAVDPVKVAGFLIGTPVTLAGLIKIFGNPTNQDLMRAAEVGAGAGTFLAFHHQAKDLCVYVGKAIANGSRQIKTLKREICSPAFNAAINISLAIEEARGFRTNFPERRSIKPRSVIVSRL